MHCAMSAYAMIIDYFLGKKLSWSELEELSGYQPGKAAWTVQALPKLASMGLDIRMIEPFDYPKFLKQGQPYLKTLYSDEEIAWYQKNSNIAQMKHFIPDFLAKIKYKCRRANLKDIDDMLKDGRLIFVTVNSKTLNDKDGFISHAVVIFDKDGDNYILHDPGLPPRANRKVSAAKLFKAMGGAENTAEITGFKLAAG